MFKKPTSFIVLLCLVLSSCSLWRSRRPASERETIVAEANRDAILASQYIGVDSLECSKNFNKLYQRLLNTAGVSTYFDTTDIKSIDEDIQTSFETRLAIKDSFKKFKNNKIVDNQCLSAAQDVLRALRYIEDYLVELHFEKDGSSTSDFVNLKGEFPNLLINPKYASDFKSYEDLKSGDVILSRGNAYSSAAIARIAVSDYQFSHLSFVYREPTSTQMFTTEAHIEIGSVTAPFKDHLEEKNVRTVVFRHKDQALANEASKAIFNRVKKYQDSGKNVEYDFSMNYKDDSRLYCSEIISAGFKLANPQSDYIPKFKSHFSEGMIPFLNTIGVPLKKDSVETTDVFAPGDIQLDPDFELVAEWRNPKKLEESRFKDFILTKIFEKMDHEGYRFDGNLKMDTQSKVYWLLRRSPLIKKFIEKKFPLNMGPTQLEVFMVLDKIGETIYKNLELHSIEYDHPMTPKEIYAVIDDFISKDLELYKNYKKGLETPKPSIHLLFHP